MHAGDHADTLLMLFIYFLLVSFLILEEEKNGGTHGDEYYKILAQ